MQSAASSIGSNLGFGVSLKDITTEWDGAGFELPTSWAAVAQTTAYQQCWSIFQSECTLHGVIQQWRQCIVEVAHSPCEFPQAELLQRWMKRSGLLARPWVFVFLNVQKQRRFRPFVSPRKEKNKQTKFFFFLKSTMRFQMPGVLFHKQIFTSRAANLPPHFICLYNLLGKA